MSDFSSPRRPRLTQTHVEFWQTHQPQPAWLAHLQTERDKKLAQWRTGLGQLVDVCINEHAGLRQTPGELAHWNLISLVRKRVGQGDALELVAFLEYLGTNTEPLHKRRAATARKWARKLRLQMFHRWLSKEERRAIG